MRGKPAFTLIELLVVIAIVALLIAILLPALRQARQVSESARCKSQLRQIGVLMQIYYDDYTRWPNASNGLDAWSRTLIDGGYINSPTFGKESVFNCPSRSPAYWAGYNTIYGMRATQHTGPPTQLDELKAPSDWWWIIDSLNSLTTPLQVYQISPDWAQPDGRKPECRHQGVANALFADGHVAGVEHKRLASENRTPLPVGP